MPVSGRTGLAATRLTQPRFYVLSFTMYVPLSSYTFLGYRIEGFWWIELIIENWDCWRVQVPCSKSEIKTRPINHSERCNKQVKPEGRKTITQAKKTLLCLAYLKCWNHRILDSESPFYSFSALHYVLNPWSFPAFPGPLATLYRGIYYQLELLTKAEATSQHGGAFAKYWQIPFAHPYMELMLTW